jgi:MFS family permease
MIDSLITPPWCRLQDGKSPPMTLKLNIIFAFCGGFSSAGLYYSHPILNLLAEDFNTTQSGVANIPTLAQAGEAACLLLILPLADYFPRRKFALLLSTLATLFW